jgi:uncharacterized membrane protein
VKKTLDFVKTTILGGLVAIVPLAVLIVSLGMILQVLLDISVVLKDVLPFPPLINTVIVFAVAAVALLIICFAAGLLVKTAFGHASVEKMHAFFSKHLPLYQTVRDITRNAAGMQGREFDLALIDLHGSRARVLGAVMEELPENRVAAYIPMSPTLGVGQVYVLPADSVQKMDVPIADFAGAISQWGVGTEKLFPRPAPDHESTV